ncbi:HVO_A0556 family zinc finger protein [Halostagnicola kamekurae]|uniref:Small CPxCG-related zinc finger protein n=1 Tax=Halostagnicola kamekurae TaxID=619731 RepID=A0A1I6RUS1_9EURY|nr:HVO_A0556 family zinc finger protein [Halostagnicola kamekurae]SFS68422.1 hypothetical protein SAMN04488556_2155 [Halostagnicola kamekurae]
MSASLEQTRTETDALEQLASSRCQYCADGTLVLESYRGNDAAVCETCGTPAMQVWGGSRQ